MIPRITTLSYSTQNISMSCHNLNVLVGDMSQSVHVLMPSFISQIDEYFAVVLG
jgi:hypothetical protein